MPGLSAVVDWNSLLHQDPGLPFLASLGLAALVAITAIIAVQWRKAHQANNEACLKAKMIDRGFTADEIKSVITAGVGHKRAKRAHRHREFVQGTAD